MATQAEIERVKTWLSTLPESTQKDFKERFNSSDAVGKEKAIQNVIKIYAPETSGNKPSTSLEEYSMAGPVVRGVDAVKKGLEVGDIEHIKAKVASGLLGNAPENILQRPMQTAMAGLPGVQVGSSGVPFGEPNTPIESNSFYKNVFPQPVSEGGRQLGGDLGALIPMVIGVENLQKLVTGPKFNPQKAVQKAEKLTTEIIQPPTTELTRYKEAGMQHPAVVQASRFIKKSKTYDELVANMDDAINRSMEQRDSILKRYNRPIGGTYIDELEKFVVDNRRRGHSDWEAMKEVLDEERKWISRQKKMNSVKAQERKEYLQKLTNNLLERREKGAITENESARLQALDTLRNSLKEKIYVGMPERLKELNLMYEGLDDAKRFIARQSANAAKEVPENMIQRLVSFFRSRGGIAENVAKAASERQGSIPSVTGKIEELMQKAYWESRANPNVIVNKMNIPIRRTE